MIKCTDTYEPRGQDIPDGLAPRVTEYTSTAERSLHFIMFYGSYSGVKVVGATPTSITLEEIGRNTGSIFSWKFEGSAAEILPLIKFAYLSKDLEAACFHSPSPEWQERMIKETAEALAIFPAEARIPLPILCVCTAEPKFKDLLELLRAAISVSPTPILLENDPFQDDWDWLLSSSTQQIAMMLAVGITGEEEILAGLQSIAHGKGFEDGRKKDENLFAAIQLHREGACSFREALALAA